MLLRRKMKVPDCPKWMSNSIHDDLIEALSSGRPAIRELSSFINYLQFAMEVLQENITDYRKEMTQYIDEKIREWVSRHE
jgi:hypothetical protein